MKTLEACLPPLGCRVHPDIASQARLAPAPDGVYPLDSGILDAGLFYYAALGACQARVNTDTLFWSSIPVNLEGITARYADMCSQLPRHVASSSTAAFGVTLAHSGSASSGHTLCVLYSYPARSIVIYDSFLDKDVHLEYDVLLCDINNQRNLRMRNPLDALPPKAYRDIAWRLIFYLTVGALSWMWKSLRSSDSAQTVASIRESLPSASYTTTHRHWRLEVLPTAQRQETSDCGAMALAVARSLLAVESDMHSGDVMIPVFYLKDDPARTFTARKLCEQRMLNRYIGINDRLYMVAPRSPVTRSSARIVRSNLRRVFSSSKFTSEELLDDAFLFYTPRLALEEVLCMHVFEKHSSNRTADTVIYYDQECMEEMACDLAKICTGAGLTMDTTIYTKAQSSTSEGRGPRVVPNVAVFVDRQPWGGNGSCRGRMFLENATDLHVSKCHTVVNAVLYMDPHPSAIRELLPYASPSLSHFWLIHVASSISNTNLTAGKHVHRLRNRPELPFLSEVEVRREQDVTSVFYCNLGGNGSTQCTE